MSAAAMDGATTGTPREAGAIDGAREAAPAKINLALHVVGRRADGYHLLDSVVIHGGAADHVSVRRGGGARRTGPEDVRVALTIGGRFGDGLAADGDNLVMRAALLLAGEAERLGRAIFDVDLTLDKALPIASGLGGGSSDAAATLRLLDRVWGLGLGRDRLAALALALGADVPMCVDGRAARIGGIGEAITPLGGLPAMRLVLVNPGVPVATPAVFRGLARRDNPPLPAMPERFADVEALAAWLGETRNDLEAAAIAVAPAIGDALAWLRARPGCRVARMSGSGATCFGLFAAEGAPIEATATAPGWWVAGGAVILSA